MDEGKVWKRKRILIISLAEIDGIVCNGRIASVAEHDCRETLAAEAPTLGRIVPQKHFINYLPRMPGFECVLETELQ